MDISIWHQFSSNHSANFTVVGIFKTPDEAAQSADVIRNMLQAINEARKVMQQEQGFFPDSPTLAELEFSKKFQIQWNSISLDWAWQVEYAVRQLDNYVFIQNVMSETHNGTKPIDELITYLGGIPLIQEELNGTNAFNIDVYATAPNEDMAKTIYLELFPLFNSAQVDEDGGRSLAFEKTPTPWERFSEKVGDYSFDESILFDGYLSREALQIKMFALDFSAVGYGLPALIDYLKNKGCNDIHYIIRDLTGRD